MICRSSFAIAHVLPWHTLKQEFLRYELTDFLFLSSRVFLRSCSCDLQYSPSKNHKLPPWKSTHGRSGSHFEWNTRIFRTNKGDWDLVTCRGELSAFQTLTENGLTLRSHMFSTSHNLPQEFFRYELTDFLSSGVFLRSCSFDLQYWKPVFSFQEPQTAPLVSMRDLAAILNLPYDKSRLRSRNLSWWTVGIPNLYRKWTYLLTYLLTQHDDNVGFSFRSWNQKNWALGS